MELDINISPHEKSKSSTHDLFVFHFKGNENPDSFVIRDEFDDRLVKEPMKYIDWIYGTSVLLDTQYNIYTTMKCDESMLKQIYKNVGKSYTDTGGGGSSINLFAFNASKEMRIKLNCSGYYVAMKKSKICIKY